MVLVVVQYFDAWKAYRISVATVLAELLFNVKTTGFPLLMLNRFL